MNGEQLIVFFITKMSQNEPIRALQIHFVADDK